MNIRPITSQDIPAVKELLCEGFPLKTAQYWQDSLETLGARPVVEGLHQFGLVLDIDNRLQGVMLLLGSCMADQKYCNLSSWYVRPDYRKYSPFLFRKCLQTKDVIYTDCSPAAHVLPIVEKFGFSAYSGGTLRFDVRSVYKSASPLETLTLAKISRIAPNIQALVQAQLAYGCSGLLLETQEEETIPLLYRKLRIKHVIPAARFIFGDPQILLGNIGGIMRKLLPLGIPVVFIDAPQEVTTPSGTLMPDYGARYFRGNRPPELGNLCETEIAVFGF